MDQNIYKPSLTGDESEAVRTYDINKLFYVAFIGGIIPLVALGTRNSIWLKLDNKPIILMLCAGIAAFFMKFIAIGMYFSGALDIDLNLIKWGYRVVSVLVFLGYLFIMKRKFELFQMTDAETKPILKDAVIWSLAGITIEIVGILLVGGGNFVANAI